MRYLQTFYFLTIIAHNNIYLRN